jgi:hypothetical protein
MRGRQVIEEQAEMGTSDSYLHHLELILEVLLDIREQLADYGEKTQPGIYLR